MKKLLTLLALASSLAIGVAHATTTPAQAAQQSKMKACNADAKTQSLKGDARKAFMKTCLSGKKPAESAAASAAVATTQPAPAAAAAATTQQTKMATCNADAKTQKLVGEARKQFMRTCLKG